MKLSGLGLLFPGRFLIIVSFSMLVMHLLRFSIFPRSVLESYAFLRICPTGDQPQLDPGYPKRGRHGERDI